MRSVAVVSIVVVIAVVAAGTGGAVPAALDRPSSDRTATTTTATNHSTASFGSHLSSFMQSSAAQASGSVETGMWVAAYENASNQSRRTLVTRRTAQLDRRMVTLQAEKRALRAAKRNGSISPTEYRSRLSQILGRLAALKEGIDAVDRPDAPGLNRTAIRAMNNRADRLAGPEISEIARSMGGPRASPGPPAWVETRPGPAVNRSGGGPPQNPSSQGNSSNATNPDGTGPPAGAGNGTANGGGNGASEGGGGGQGDGGGSDGNPGSGNGGSGGDKADEGSGS